MQRIRPGALGWLRRWCFTWLRVWHRAVLLALQHDSLNLAQSAAYSAIIALFPALAVAAAAVVYLPDSAPLRQQLGTFFDRILPSDVTPVLTAYFDASPSGHPVPHSARALAVAVLVSVTGASSVLATLMEGLRRANRLPEDCWNFYQRRGRALALIPASLLPFIAASILVVFGHVITSEIVRDVVPVLQSPIFVLADILRWLVALSGAVEVTALLYFAGTPLRQPWHRTLPGACVSTAMWFLATVAFGWYVTRFANYSRVYGSLGAGIALLIWLYLIFFSVLCGAEFNAEFARTRNLPS